jgi:hypothetical protein
LDIVGNHIGFRGRRNVVAAARFALRAAAPQPSLTLEWVEKYHGIVRAEDRARYIEGLRLAGLM